jgi:peroxiredoxin Q/BCP
MRGLPEIGQLAPDFTLPDADGKQIALKDLKGKWVVLYFYPKDNTSGCTVEALEFTVLLEAFQKLNAVVLGVSPDSCKSHQKFIEKQSLKVTLLSDENHEVIERFGFWVEKSMYGKKYMGVQRGTVLIDPEGVVRHIWPKVKARGHAEEVLNMLKTLQKG